MSLVARLLALVALAVAPALTVVAYNEQSLRRVKDAERLGASCPRPRRSLVALRGHMRKWRTLWRRGTGTNIS